jgi:NADPH2:quinone reductase
MKAVAYRTPGPIDREDALQDITLERPQAEGRDLLVKINAVSVNPVDTKLRLGAVPEGGDWRVLGFDAAAGLPRAESYCPVPPVFLDYVAPCIQPAG